MSIDIRGGAVVTPSETLEAGRVVTQDGRIDRIEGSSPAWRRSADTIIDASGCVVLPGLVDLHGDDIERQLFPRVEAAIEPSHALVCSDRFNLFNGITTKFHAIAFEDAPADNRSIELATRVARAVDRADDLVIDNRVHARCELASESVESIEALIDADMVDLVSLMHHRPGGGQFADEAAFARRYLDRCEASEAEAMTLGQRRESTPPAVIDRRAERLTRRATAAGIPVASHDDDDPERIDRLAGYGVSISEYPITLAAARHAARRGLWTVMGASNLRNGGSLWDNLDASRAIAADVLDILCSDYHPPSMLGACFAETDEPLHERAARLTARPAAAVGLEDRGVLEAGARADVIVVDPTPVPTVAYAVVGGRCVYNVGRVRAVDRAGTPVETEGAVHR